MKTADTPQGDVYDHDKQPLSFWKQVQAEMLEKSWISGSVSLYEVLACRHFDWEVAEVYRGGYNHTLAHPILVIGSPYVSPAADSIQLHPLLYTPAPLVHNRALSPVHDATPITLRLLLYDPMTHDAQDPATPLRTARELTEAMGQNARLSTFPRCSSA